MTKFKNFLSFVEIRTKLCSFLPFFIGISYVLYRFGTENFSIKYTLIFLVAMFLFDMSVTAINNHIGAREQGTYRHYSNGTGIAIIVTFILIASILGIIMTLQYGLVVLACGGICFAVGIFYTFGPIAIYRSPYGEILSGLVQGFFITFINAYMNTASDTFITLNFSGTDFLGLDSIIIGANFFELLRIVIVTIPSMLLISNIMLANNTCDIEQDVSVRRYTMPYYIGRKKAVKLLSILYHTAFIVIIIAVITRIISPLCLLVLLLYPKVRGHINLFKEKQIKPDTFIPQVQNFTIISTAYAVTLFLGAVLKFILERS